ncbi:uncharacterized protein LOC131410477 [Diceros bicornis minor]|uniref:uncharacterized protein LOC131410477 n=1 Tax=Diceros bicornis minor TaxID=77932 RepID=UPI0026EA5A59|nr:uncharacterized protein LOC131410477 [Diceros bicornis minor]
MLARGTGLLSSALQRRRKVTRLTRRLHDGAHTAATARLHRSPDKPNRQGPVKAGLGAAGGARARARGVRTGGSRPGPQVPRSPSAAEPPARPPSAGSEPTPTPPPAPPAGLTSAGSRAFRAVQPGRRRSLRLRIPPPGPRRPQRARHGSAGSRASPAGPGPRTRPGNVAREPDGGLPSGKVREHGPLCRRSRARPRPPRRPDPFLRRAPPEPSAARTSSAGSGPGSRAWGPNLFQPSDWAHGAVSIDPGVLAMGPRRNCLPAQSKARAAEKEPETWM